MANRWFNQNVVNPQDYIDWWDEYNKMDDSTSLEYSNAMNDEWNKGAWNTGKEAATTYKNKGITFSQFADAPGGKFLLSRPRARKGIKEAYGLSDEVGALIDKGDIAGAIKLAEEQNNKPEEKPQLADSNTETQKIAPEAQAAAQMEDADKVEEPEVKQETKEPENKLTSALTSDGSVKAVAEAAKSNKKEPKEKKSLSERLGDAEEWTKKPLYKGTDITWADLINSGADAASRVNIPEYVLEAVTTGKTPGSKDSQYSKNLADMARINAIGEANRKHQVKNAANKPKADMAANVQRVKNIVGENVDDDTVRFIANHLEDEEMSYETFVDNFESYNPDLYSSMKENAFHIVSQPMQNAEGQTLDDLWKQVQSMDQNDPRYQDALDAFDETRTEVEKDANEAFKMGIERLYNNYLSARQQSTQSLSNTAARRNIEGQELSNIYKNLDNQIRGIQSDKEYTDLINGIDNTITSLSKLKLDANHEVNITNFFDSERQLMSIVDGVYMYNEGKSSGLQAGIGFKGAEFSGDLSKSQSKVVDALRKANIPLAKEKAEGQLKVEKADLDRYNAFIDQQIKDLQDAKKEIQARHGQTSMIPQTNPNSAVSWDDHMNKWRTPTKPEPTFESMLKQWS